MAVIDNGVQSFRQQSSYPKFSVVIPTFNRLSELARCLSAVAEIDYPRDRFEVIVVDDGGSVGVELFVRAFSERMPITCVRQANVGPAAARNHGASYATGDFLVFIDDDCVPANDWLKQLALNFEIDPQRIIGGLTLNGLADNPYSCASQMIIDYLYSYYNNNTHKRQFFASNNFAVPSRLFYDMGGFNTSYSIAAGEDRELCERWSGAGYKTAYVPQVVIRHFNQLTLGTYLLQHVRYGRGAYRFRKGAAVSRGWLINFEPASFYLRLIIYPRLQARGVKAFLSMLLLLLAQAANTAGFFCEMFVSSRRGRG
jgi:glycosyltransferase involved in cell wall biosynthesis